MRILCLHLAAPPCFLPKGILRIAKARTGVTQAQVCVTDNGCFGVWPKRIYS